MRKIGKIIHSAQKLLPAELIDEFTEQLDIAETSEASPAGAIFMGIYILEYLGFPRYIDEILGEEHTTIDQLRNHYNNKPALAKPMIPSTGIILSLMVADMVARPRNITPAYKFEEMAQNWE